MAQLRNKNKLNIKKLIFNESVDTVFFYIMLALIFIGSIMLLSTSAVVGFANYSDGYFFIKKHCLFIFLGAVCFLAGLSLPHQIYKKYVMPGLIVSTLLLIGTFLPVIGVNAGGASRWLNLGLLHFQPIEVAKFFIIVFISTSIVNKGEDIKDFTKGVLPILLIVCLPVLILILQPDLGNALLILGITIVMLFISDMRLDHILLLMLGGILFIITTVLTHSYQLQRITSFLSPWDDPMGKNYHIIQSFIAIGSGGIFGLGLGQSKLKFFYLPLHYSDFIFSIICEEGGFILALIVLGLFIALFYKGVHIAIKSGNAFSFYLAFGLTLLLVMQALINICVVIGIFPITGIPLTFISFGGSSFVTSMFAVGVIMNVSKESNRLNNK
jgi:cell division protein FtsW